MARDVGHGEQGKSMSGKFSSALPERSTVAVGSDWGPARMNVVGHP